jgi:hypothetical protein
MLAASALGWSARAQLTEGLAQQWASLTHSFVGQR